MKNISTIIICFLLLVFSSCKKSKFLEYDFYDGSATDEQFWNLNSPSRGQLNRGYTFLKDNYNRYDGAMLAAGSDEAVNSNLNSTVNIFNNGTWSSLRTIDDSYADNYNGIRQVNVFLENAHRAMILPITEVPRFKGEAFFLRAFFHFELLKRYGGVIIANKVFSIADDLDVPRNTFDETVTQILKDCDSAALILPLSPTQYASGERGRATKAAALALKSRTLLYAASPLNNPSNDIIRWAKAAAAAKELMNTNAHSLLANYANIFNFGTAPFNTEVIFATQATNRNDIEINNAPISYSGASGRTNPTQELVDAYDMRNGLPISAPNSGYDPSNPYANRDPRLAQSVILNNSTFKGTVVKTNTAGKDGIGQNINATKTGYYMRKFLSESATWNQATNTMVRRPWVHFRYAEILLNYAEAENEATGPIAEVYSAINLIRKRAGIPDLPPGLTKVQMRERIRNERRVELAFEEHRFYDVRRWMIGEATLGKPITGMMITETGTTLKYERFTVETRVFHERMYRFPIPQSEINNSTKLQQNSGY